MSLFMTRRIAALALCMTAQLCLAQSAPPEAQDVRVRGTVQSLEAGLLTVRASTGEVVKLVLPDGMTVSEVYPIALSDIQPGSFIGTAAMPQPDGSERAVAVTVFPEYARGRGEGHRAFDLLPQSTMTNATVASMVASSKGRTLKLQYKDGERNIVVPEGAPIVTFRPGTRSLLVPGASVSLSARVMGEKPTVTRINAGGKGFTLPY